eukprot:scaffold5513_cov18-Tisochrysis_lutea.AAC.1
MAHFRARSPAPECLHKPAPGRAGRSKKKCPGPYQSSEDHASDNLSVAGNGSTPCMALRQYTPAPVTILLWMPFPLLLLVRHPLQVQYPGWPLWGIHEGQSRRFGWPWSMSSARKKGPCVRAGKRGIGKKKLLQLSSLVGEVGWQ